MRCLIGINKKGNKYEDSIVGNLVLSPNYLAKELGKSLIILVYRKLDKDKRERRESVRLREGAETVLVPLFVCLWCLPPQPVYFFCHCQNTN